MPLNPPDDPTVTVAFADWPGMIDAGVVEDVTDIVKLVGAVVTASETKALVCSPPAAPITTSV